VRRGRDGVEAQRELLVNGAVGVEKNMGGIAVDIGQPGERDGHSQLLGDLAGHRLGGGFADLDVLPRTDMATSTMASSAILPAPVRRSGG